MFAFPKLRSLFLVAGLIIFGVSRSSASPIPIQDNGAFFSDSAKSEASRNISELEKTTKKGVVVQTFKELPADVKQGLNLEDKKAVKDAVAKWTLKEARSSGVNGVYILLVKSPPDLQVEVGLDTQKRAFTLKDRDTLVSAMLVRLRAKQFDDALLEGVNFISATMRANAPSGRTNITTQNAPRGGYSNPSTYLGSSQPQHHSSGWLIPLLIGAVVVWIIISIIRSLFRGGGGGGVGPGGMMSPMGGGYGGGGGGFFSSLLGGVFGAAAGNWLYDQFSGNRGNSTWGSERDNNQGNQNSGDQGYTGTDTDYSGSGGSFGDDSGSGSGGGDSGGGGDFGGGGDSGGGGDFGGGGDSGGGGGDF